MAPRDGEAALVLWDRSEAHGPAEGALGGAEPTTRVLQLQAIQGLGQLEPGLGSRRYERCVPRSWGHYTWPVEYKVTGSVPVDHGVTDT